MLLEELGRPIAELLDLVSVRGLDERLARRIVAVERADADARSSRNAFDSLG